jgi:DHA1 family inner membrane transport protein
MTTLSPARTRLALLALALGGFGIGATEFVASGLLPNIAADLLPTLDAASHQQAIARTGIMISAYAAGVVVGAPTIAIFAARLPRKGLLLALVAAFTVGSLASALAPTFPTLVIARFAAGLPHGAYFGIASLVAASLMGPGKRGRALSAVAILVAVPRRPGDPHATIARELGGFRRLSVWVVLATAAFGFGGFFAVQSYLAPLATQVAGLPAGFIPLVLVVLGLGMTVGNQIGGRLADRGAARALFICFGAFAASFVVLGLSAHTPVGLFIGVFLVAASTLALTPSIQTRLMDVAGESQTLAAAANHSALNIGNSLGAVLGAVVIGAGYGYLAPTWVGLALCVPGIALAIFGALLTRGKPSANSAATVTPNSAATATPGSSSEPVLAGEGAANG